jgi:predicted transcriptional regulator
MMTSNKLKNIIQNIKDTHQEVHVTPRELFMFFDFEKRTEGNRRYVDEFLNDNQVEVIPGYMTTGMDEQIALRYKKTARSRTNIDPIKKIRMLESANTPPITVTREAKLKEAITLMMMHDISQLPVVSGTRTVQGVISWETIGHGLNNGSDSELVIDFIQNDVTILDQETPLLDAISDILKKGFVLVQRADKTLCGIVTLTDLSTQFLIVSEPFLLLEQIEHHIRQILDGKFYITELKEYIQYGDIERKIEFIEDLSFGDYIRIIEKPEHWDRLQLNIERSHFIKHLDKIREIRNDIMHFDPDGISTEQKEDLTKMAKFLSEVIKFE